MWYMWCIKCNVCVCLEVCKDKSEMKNELSCEKERRKMMNCENCGDGNQKDFFVHILFYYFIHQSNY